ncbi:Inositol 2-dehydrogenase/D-chiro-inositol 3-dehydrogenase [Actinomadura sp. RB99]|uniref:Gfo/Idh/MocA family protein n=1 Tax=Actinomadura sp. RB99 TaxID=2691577 RepID=UPI0016826555|nr:Gfo/Idh/MocA family oxidoreductase [Actinomadura sp. RB99]MBD2896182.1 Inositol 2-dehydrogenase/D-chiro-inositol 3-dehydrogenase [Actinomadura sp. RB99]
MKPAPDGHQDAAVTRRPWRVAVVGCGGAAYGIHLPVLSAHPAVEIAAVYDREIGRAEQAVSRFGSRVAANTAQLLEGADLLAVLTGVHEPWIEAALAAGVHVFTEKPVSLDLDRTRRLCRQADAAALLLEVGAIRAFDSAVAELRRELPEHELRGGWMVKADGHDAAARQPFLPPGAAPYTFGTDREPQPPAVLGPVGGRALKILLWQGYHLLTTMALTVPNARPVSCTLSQDRATVHGIVRAPNGATIACTIGSAPPGVHLDQVTLTGSDTTLTAQFPPPYGPAGAGTLAAHSAQQRPPLPPRGDDLPAQRMWSAIADRLTAHGRRRAVPAGTRHIAEGVEQLAYGLARLTTVNDPASSTGESVPLTSEQP